MFVCFEFKLHSVNKSGQFLNYLFIMLHFDTPNVDFKRCRNVTLETTLFREALTPQNGETHSNNSSLLGLERNEIK